MTKRKAAIIASQPALRAYIAGEQAEATASVAGDAAGANGESSCSSFAVPAAAVASINPAAGEILSPSYSLLPVDLKDLAALGQAVQRAGFDLRCEHVAASTAAVGCLC